ncbi:MAG: diaminopimelate decarboxylase family protein [Methanosarcinales archaeon]
MILDKGHWNKYIDKTESNHRQIYGVDMVELAESYGTPLYVLFEDIIEENYKKYQNALYKVYKDHLICYAVKANTTFDVIKLLAKLGSGADVASEYEMQFALDAGILPSKIRANGNCKSEYYLEECIEKKIIINVDPEEELEVIQNIAKERGVRAKINLRLAGFPLEHITSTAITTSSEWSKFGIDIKNASEMFQKVLDLDYLIPNGLMVHLGSQITDIKAYYIVLDELIELSKSAQRIGFDINEIDLGGGLGIQYFEVEDWNAIKMKIKNTRTANYTWANELIGYEYNTKTKELEWIGEELSCVYTPDVFIEKLFNKKYSLDKTFKEKLEEIGTPKFVIEPGRSIVGNAGVTIAKIGRVSKTPNSQNMVHVDAGVNFHTFGMAVPEQLHRIEIANNIEEGELFETFVAGNLCFTGDLLFKVKNKLVRKPKRGDYLLFYDTGAYADFFASNANSFPRPAKVMVAKDGKHRLLVKREDLFEVFHREVDWRIKKDN